MGQLSNHKKSHHEEIQYDCKQCDYKAPNRSSLRNNRKSLHEGIRYNCDQCKDTINCLEKTMKISHFNYTRSYAALWAADLDWIVGPGYSLGRVHSGEKP